VAARRAGVGGERVCVVRGWAGRGLSAKCCGRPFAVSLDPGYMAKTLFVMCHDPRHTANTVFAVCPCPRHTANKLSINIYFQ